MAKQYDYLIVGAGLFGATFAHQAHLHGKKCLVIDKRSHLGGNLYCENVHGINVHKYGAHIFHTSDKAVWQYVNSLVEFNRYTNSPIANYNGELYNLPFNMNTFNRMWGVTTPQQAKEIIEQQRSDVLAQLDGKEPQNLEQQALMLVGKDIYEKLIKGYTEKQWGRPCTQLPPFIIRRLPLRFVYDNNYFNDTYQGIPVGGYNKLIDAMLNGVECITDVDFFDNREAYEEMAETVVFTGKIDEYYDYRFGKLQYRTVRFEEETLSCSNFQGNAVVNYTAKEVPFTRVIEHKHFEMFGEAVERVPVTIISREYSTEWHEGLEPYYPINDAANMARYEQYRALADAEPHTIFGGRLAEYRYYDMSPIIARVLSLWSAH